VSTHIRTSKARAESLLAGQKRALELAVNGAPLRFVLDALALALESNLERRTFVSVLLVDRDGKHLRHGAAPSLPEPYNHAIDGIEIGAEMGSCGTAAFRKMPVIVSDIQSDPLWRAFRGLAQEHGLAACWSTPILSTTGAVLGTFALYYPTPEEPWHSEREAVELLAHTAAIVIERDRSQEDLEASAERYRLVSEASRDAIWDWDLVTGEVVWSPGAQKNFGSVPGESPTWWRERVHPEDRDRVEQSLKRVISDGHDAWEEEYRFLVQDGSYAVVVDRAQIVRDHAGAGVRMVGSMVNRTERRRIQERDRFLVKLDDALRVLIESEEITFTAATLLGQYLLANRCAYATVEADEDTFHLTGNYTNGVGSIVGRYTFRQFGEECLRLMRAGEPYIVSDSETDQRVTDAERPSYLATEIRAVICVPILKQGRFVAAMAVHTNTTRVWKPYEVKLVQQVASRSWESIERARVSRTLQESERQFRQLANSIANLAWMARPDGWIHWYNEQWYRYTGTTPEEMEGWGWTRVHDPQVLPTVMQEWEASIRTGNPFEMVFPIRRADGSFRRFLTRVNPVRNSLDEIVGWFGTNTDVEGERRAAETLFEAQREREELLEREQRAREDAELQKRLLHSLFMQAPTLIGILRGPQHIIELANPRLCEVWGYPDEHVQDRALFELLPELETQVFKQLLSEVFRTGKPYVGTETPTVFHRANGQHETVYFNFVYSPYRTIEGEIEGVFVVATDVTSQVLARQQIENLRDAAESANRAKDEFLAILGHELRNPLSPILTALQLMKMKQGDSEREREVIERQVKHLTRLVDDLLDVSRIAKGKVDLKRDVVELSEVLEKALEHAGPLIEERSHRLRVDVPGEGLPVDGDPIRLTQIASNLVTNAAKYTEPGGEITITGAREGEDVVVRVRDTGIGIASEMLPHVFDLFVQERQGSDRARGGLGLGLTIVRSLVERHGGSVAVHSEGPGKGSEFIVRLPMATGPEKAFVARAPSQTQVETATPRRILVVDDNVDAAQMLAVALSGMGHRTQIAYDGPSAIEAARRFSPDLALLDIGLPVMDGYELAARLRTLPGLASVRLIALSGYGQESDRARSRAAGFDGHLVKPVELDALNSVFGDEPKRANGL